MIENLKQIRRKLLRHFKIRPIHKVINELKRLDYLCMKETLEVFGKTGEYHTLDYINNVENLEIWEISQDCESKLKKNFPNAKVKITDSYEEIKKTKNIYDTIIIDNHQGLFGIDKCEHFEIIDDCFDRLANKSVLITNIIPNILSSKYKVPDEVIKNHIKRRETFYGLYTGTLIELSYFEEFYTKMAQKRGFTVNHVFFIKRNYLMTYIVLCLKKNEL